MVDDETAADKPAPRRVVRRVVKRTVVAPPPPTVSRVRPVAREDQPSTTSTSTREPSPDRPTRAGGRRRARVPLRERLVSLRPTRARPDEPEPTEPEPTEPDPVEPGARQHEPHEPAPTPERAEPRVPLRERWSSTTVAAREQVSHLVDRAATLPRPGYAALVGLGLGVVTVLVCWLATLVFAATLGTPAGGRWGFGVLVLVGIAAAVAGTRLLAAADVPEPGGTSVIAVLLVPVVVLALFLGISTTVWAAVVVPLLGAASFAVVQPLTERLSGRPRDTTA